MSIRVMSKMWEAVPYEGKKLLVLLALCDFADDEGNCWPKMDTIARKARCSPQYARECIRWFEQDGILATKKGPGIGNTNTYKIASEARFSKARLWPSENRASSTSPGHYKEPSKEPLGKSADEDEDTAPVTVEEEGASRVESPDSPPPSSGGSSGTRENHVDPIPKQSRLSRSQVGTHMRKLKAPQWVIDAVQGADDPSAAYYGWLETRQLPEGGSTVPATTPGRVTLKDKVHRNLAILDEIIND